MHRSLLAPLAALLAGAAWAAPAPAGDVLPRLDIDLALDTPGPGVHTVVLPVTGGPPGGLAVYGLSLDSSPGIPTAFGSLLLDPTTLLLVGDAPLDGAGTGSLALPYAASIGDFTVVLQAAAVDLVGGTAALTNNVSASHGIAADGQCVGDATYNDLTQVWVATVTNTTGAVRSVTVEWFDASAGTVTVQLATSVPPGSVSTFTGTVDLDFGDNLVVKCNGEVVASLKC